MPPPRFHPKPKSHGASSFLRFLFPRTRQRARERLHKLRYESLPSLKHNAQSRIYKYIVYRQAQKLRKKPGILQRLRGHTRRLLGSGYLENEVRLRRQKLNKAGGPEDTKQIAMSYQEQYGAREPGQRRRKLAGYLKAANELRQTYQQQYAGGWSRGPANYEYDDTNSDPTDAAIVRNGDEEMILFPSYARKHIKRKPEAEPGTIQETGGEGRDVRDTAGAGDAEFWKQQWDNYEDDNAIVDVDVRGWVYSPHKGQMNRKQRLFIGLARQLVGLQSAPTSSRPLSASPSPLGSREPSPGSLERQQAQEEQREQYLTAKEAENIYRRGEKEAEMAARGAYSEQPSSEDTDSPSLHRTDSKESIRTTASMKQSSVGKRESWNQPADMNPAELAEANARLMARLRHFLAIPMANSPISIFFYNDKISKQRTVYTNPSGHFSICAALDFVPTHVRVLASDKLSATEEILVTESRGISVISDIDDTIKHSAISAGAREIFRNAFIRDLGDLTIEGVREWYNRMAELGVKFHYVSNSPWQLFPVISKYFNMAGLPPGSFHLKQYSGMMQGIFEPVAERKKGTLDKIARDFPERRFILIGDSGEADLEVYTDFVLENPGRVIAVYIRDVTTTEGSGFFDPSIAPIPQDFSSSSSQRGSASNSSRLASSSSGVDDNDPEMKAAIEASLREMEADKQRRSKSLFPQIDEDHPHLRPNLPPRRPSPPKASQTSSNLIDLSSDDEGPEPLTANRRTNSDTQVETAGNTSSTASTKSAPPLPRKPVSLRSASTEFSSSPTSTPPASPKPAPPKPRRPSSNVHSSSPLTQPPSKPSPPSQSRKPAPQPEETQSTASRAKDGLVAAYNHLPAIRSTNDSHNTPDQSTTPTAGGGRKPAPPPPPPPRRGYGHGVTAYPLAAASYVGGKAVSAWQNAPSVPLSRPGVHSGGAVAPAAGAPYSTNSGNSSGGVGRSGGAAPGGNGNGNGNNGNGGNGNGNGNGNAAAGAVDGMDYGTYNNSYGQPVMNKREVMWRQRWRRAEQILADDGVELRTWRVGSDILGESVRLIEGKLKREGGEVGESTVRERKGDGNGGNGGSRERG